MPAGAETPDIEFRRTVARLLDVDVARLSFEPVTGGVSSDIWQVRHGSRSYCAKRALPRLKVASRWEAPVSRNAEEVRWLRTVRPWAGTRVAEVVAADAAAGIAVLSWYEPAHWRNWKVEMLAGRVSPACAGGLGTLLGTIAREAASAPHLAAQFANDELFDALRIDPFFRHVAHRYPDLDGLIEMLRRGHATLVHGDFSPKNVLVNDRGELVVLDAECACWGHPAFDPGYLLAHLLLKELHTGHSLLLPAANAFWQAYQRALDGTFPALEESVVRVVGGMLVARVAGKSPVEYLTADEATLAVEQGTRLLQAPPTMAALLTR